MTAGFKCDICNKLFAGEPCAEITGKVNVTGKVMTDTLKIRAFFDEEQRDMCEKCFRAIISKIATSKKTGLIEKVTNSIGGKGEQE